MPSLTFTNMLYWPTGTDMLKMKAAGVTRMAMKAGDAFKVAYVHS